MAGEDSKAVAELTAAVAALAQANAQQAQAIAALQMQVGALHQRTQQLADWMTQTIPRRSGVGSPRCR